MENVSTVELLGTIFFACAVLHTFFVKQFQKLAHRYPHGSVGENLFHLLGEVEVVFGFWAGILVLFIAIHLGQHAAIDYLNNTHFTEPVFVFVVMCMAATRPVTHIAERAIHVATHLIPVNRNLGFYVVALIVGPLLGSFITEPAAMTVTALILKDMYFDKDISERFKYITIATLFVNVSVGGTLTTFAAPPVLMVAGKWNWDASFMISHFGYKSAIGVVINTILASAVLYKELVGLPKGPTRIERAKVPPLWLVGIHLAFLAGVVMTSHYIPVFLPLFLYFIGIVAITKEYQDELKLKDSLLVGFFLAGLILLGNQQKWWLQEVLTSLNEGSLFLGATILTAFTDNAALTYLGSQVESISEGFKYALVAGAVAGGGLTVIANAPNPAGYSLLKDRFGATGISPAGLIKAALVPTLVVMGCLWFLP